MTRVCLALLLGLVLPMAVMGVPFTRVTLDLVCGMNENVTAAPFDYGVQAFLTNLSFSQGEYDSLKAWAIEGHLETYGVDFSLGPFPGDIYASSNGLWILAPLAATGDYHCSTIRDEEGDLRGDFDPSNPPVFRLGEFVASVNKNVYPLICANGCNYTGTYKGAIHPDHILAFGRYQVIQFKQGRPISPGEDASKWKNITETMTMESYIPGVKSQDDDDRQQLLNENFVMRSATRGTGIAALQIAIGTKPNEEGKFKIYLHNSVQYPAPRGIPGLRL